MSVFNPNAQVPSPALLVQLEALIDRGLFLQAFALASEQGDPRYWQGPEAMTCMARLAGHIGAPRLADVLTWLAYRRYPQSFHARLRFLRMQMARRGHYRAWRLLQAFADWLPAEAAQQAEWLSFKAYLYASLRDFETAQALYEQACLHGDGDLWLLVERSHGLELEDRREEALALCQQVLARQPDFRSALSQAASLQLQLGQVDRALQLLRRGAREMQSAAICAHLVNVLIERDELDEARAWLDHMQTLERIEERSPTDWIAARRCDIACLQGDHGAGRQWAEKAGGGFYEKIQAHLASPSGRRVLLPVPFVRQHHMTCVPATLTAISDYWGKRVEHLEVAEEICYDGTSHQAERAWAERNGYLAVEFTADWATSRALIDRGMPFTLTLQYTGSGHLQALVGYDEPRGTLLVRDPAQPHHGESLAELLFASQRASGPRAMLLLPADQAARLDGLDLPDRKLWDHYYRFTTALEVHQRDEALAAYHALQALSPEHRLTWQAQRSMGWYDGQEREVLRGTEALLAQFPEDANLILSKATSLAQLQPRGVQLAWLAGHCRQRWNEPTISVRYAELLSDDGRCHGQVAEILQRVLLQTPTQARAWNTLASLRWGENRREEACELYRLAACLHASHEGYAVQYFRALRALGRTGEGLQFLERRQVRLGRQAAAPSLTLSETLEEMQRPYEAQAVLEQALAWRPTDGELLLGLAEHHGRNGDAQACQALLGQAEPLCRRAAWLRAAVQAGMRRLEDPRQTLVWAREAALLEPLAVGAHRLCVTLLEQGQGSEAADAYVEALAAEYPHHLGIAELQVERAKRRSLPATERALRRLLDNHPEHAWTLRELAGCLARQGGRGEALEVCRQAGLVDAQNTYFHSTHGFVLLQDGQRGAAREAFQQALRLFADNEYASNMLLDTCESQQQAVATLAAIHAELTRQVTFGDGWLAYEQQAQRLLEPQVLLDQLREALGQREDLWQLWVVVARQQACMEQYAAAADTLGRAIERFPLLPRLALELARLHKHQGELDACCQALQESFRINPLWTPTVSLYVDCLLEQGERLEEAEQQLRRVVAQVPEDTELRAYLAYVLGRRDAFAEAADQAERVLRAEPGHEWAWNQLKYYAEKLQAEGRPLQLARQLVENRPGDVDAWLALADLDDDREAREKALRAALAYSPRSRGINDRLLQLLMEGERFGEVREVLAAPCWEGKPPVEMALYGPRALRAEGDTGAIEALRGLLAQHPDHYDGWRQLADWHDEDGQYPAYIAAARQMVRLEPRLAMAHGFLGHALLLNGDKAEALPALEQAWALDGRYGFAALNSFDLLRELQGPGAALARLDALLDAGDPVAAWRRVLPLARGNGDKALLQRALTTLASEPAAEATWEQDVTDFAVREPVLRQVLDAGVAAGELHSAAVETWLGWRTHDMLSNLTLSAAFDKALRNDPRHAAKCAMLRLLGGHRHANRILLGSTLKRCRQALAENADVWGAASYALIESKRYRLMFETLSDWRRPDTQAWALDNLALGYRLRGMDSIAAEVSQLSLERDPRGADGLVWLAVDAALAGDQAELNSLIERLQDASLRDYYRALFKLAQCAATADPAQARETLRQAEGMAGHGHLPFWRLRQRLGVRLGWHGEFPTARVRWRLRRWWKS
ncbi:C39 family peptidase [Pseudomonas sp. D2-3]